MWNVCLFTVSAVKMLICFDRCRISEGAFTVKSDANRYCSWFQVIYFNLVVEILKFYFVWFYSLIFSTRERRRKTQFLLIEQGNWNAYAIWRETFFSFWHFVLKFNKTAAAGKTQRTNIVRFLTQFQWKSIDNFFLSKLQFHCNFGRKNVKVWENGWFNRRNCSGRLGEADIKKHRYAIHL